MILAVDKEEDDKIQKSEVESNKGPVKSVDSESDMLSLVAFDFKLNQ